MKHVHSGLFKGSVLGLNEEEIHEDQFERDPHAVNNVVLPLQCAKCDGIDVLVEHKRGGDGEGEYSVTLGTKVEWENLECVGCDQGGICNAVECAVQDFVCVSMSIKSAEKQLTEEGDDGVSCSFVPMDSELCGADGLKNEENQHSRSRYEKERPPSHPVAVQAA